MPTLDDALAYARLGIPVFPLSGKQPLERAGQANVDGLVIPEGRGGFHQATVDEAKITRWWAAYPDANIGTPTGHHFDAMTNARNRYPFDVLDVDPRHGGVDSLRALLAAHEPLPPSANQITGSGGFHYCFKSSPEVRNSAGGIAPGIDVRGTGGYIVIAPSIHPDSGEKYEWNHPIIEVTLLDDFNMYGETTDVADTPNLAPWPDWLLELIREASRRRAGSEPGARIPLGMQEATLMRIAGAMRRHSATEQEILAALRVVSQERCDPPVALRDLERMARSASSYQPGDTLLDFPLDDAGNAERLVGRYGDRMRHVDDAKSELGWYYFNGKIWADNATARIVQDQLEMARAYQDAVADLPDDTPEAAAIKRAHKANAKLCAQDRGMVAMRKLAATFPEINIARTELDADPWVFAAQNGVIDLRTGALRPHSAQDMITRTSPVAYDPDARSELWENYLDWLTAGRDDLRQFLQLAVGYTMTGDVREEKLFFIHGPAASGKTTLVEALKVVMGTYSASADFSTFLKGHNVGGPRQDIARLAGARYVSSIEVDQGKSLAEGLVKQMTGGDTITARFLYGTEFEYSATHKLWLVANDAPKVNADDDGLWRRILRIPCDNVVPEGQRDPTLKLRLKDPILTGPAILAWAVEGALRWQQVGHLTVPETIKAATEDYRESQDPVIDFVKEACLTGEGLRVAFGDLWMAYLGYCKTYQRRPMGKLVFGDRLTSKGFPRARTGGGRYITGLTLAESDTSD